MNGGDDLDLLKVSDAGDLSDNTGELTSLQLSDFGMDSSLTYDGIETYNVALGPGNDLISIRGTHTPGITILDAGPGDDTYIVFDGWGNVFITEQAGRGIDTLDFSPATSNLGFIIGDGVYVSARFNLLAHQGDFIERLIGGSGDDLFTMSRPGAVLAFGRGIIIGGGGFDTISYERYAKYNHRGIYNGVGLGRAADVEKFVYPPERPAPENILLRVVDQYGDKPIDELINLVKSDPTTHRPSNGSIIPLNIDKPTAIQTPADNLVILSKNGGGRVIVEDVIEPDLGTLTPLNSSGNYLNQGGQLKSFGESSKFIKGVSVEVFNGDGSVGQLPQEDSIVVIFEIAPELIDRTVSILWWDEVRGIWREIDSTITPDGRCLAVTNLAGTFVLAAND